MGFLNMFQKDVSCQRCSKIIEKKELCCCEIEEAGARRTLQVCRACLKTEFSKALKNYPGRIVAVYPMKGYNAYHLYRFSDMPNLEYTQTFIDAVKAKMPLIDDRCSCGQSAQVRWCSPELVGGKPLDESNGVGPCDEKLLCIQCFLEEALAMGSHLQEFITPSGGDGYFTPAESIL